MAGQSRRRWASNFGPVQAYPSHPSETPNRTETLSLVRATLVRILYLPVAARDACTYGGSVRAWLFITALLGPVLAVAPYAVAQNPPLLSAKPQRVVSLNLCVDQLVLILAEPENVASVTWLSLDPKSSVVADLAAAVPVINRGTAEEALPLLPDLVLAGAYTTPFTIQMLRRFGFNVEVLGVPTNLAEVREQILWVGELLHEQERAEETVAAMNAALAAIPPPSGTSLRAAVFQPGGFTMGPGTFEHELLTAAGLHNVSEEAGITFYGFLSLEQVLILDPDLLVFPGHEARLSIAEAMLDHPALRKAGGAKRPIRLPHALWSCAGPMNVAAIALLASARG